MYKKALGALTCVYLALFGGMLCLMGTVQAGQERLADEEISDVIGQVAQIGVAEYSSSGRRVVDYLLLNNPLADRADVLETPDHLDNRQLLENSGYFDKSGATGTAETSGLLGVLELPESEVEVLQRIVEAEAGGEDVEGKLLVANVVLNRVKDEDFPNSVSGVVFQKDNGVTQFSPVGTGTYYRVEVSEETVEVVDRALAGEDISDGALYFVARKYADKKSLKWFDENLTFLFQHGGHDFFR